jgi:outer membrane protein, heavy metal efflux system
MLSTRIPLGTSAEQQSQALQARADETKAKATLSRISTTLKAQASAAQANVEWFEQLQTNAQEQAALARQVYALYQQSFNLGDTDLPTLLRLEQQAFEAERIARKSTIEYASKVSALRQAYGLLPEQAP